MRLFLSVFGILFFNTFAFCQYQLSGEVTNANNEKLDFATVFLEGTSFATSTDENGRFTILNIPKGEYTVKATFVGYNNYRKSIFIDQNLAFNIQLNGSLFQLDQVEIQSNRVNGGNVFTYSDYDKAAIKKENLGTDVPFILQWTPSVTVSSDAGTGIGYTSLRMRGVDQTRINVTLNGIPVNDAESQNVFWVDLPDLMGSTNNIQIQRGVGTSTNGNGAFGGSISINTNENRINSYIDLASSFGSFGTKKLSLNLGTGLLNSKYSVDGRYSVINSDGYIDRGSAKLNALSLSVSRVTAKSSLRLHIMDGKELTYQAWNGVPEAVINQDKAALDLHYQNNKGSLYRSEKDSINLYNSGRKYNYYTYANQVDNYGQTYIQLFHSLAFAKSKIKNTFFYTKGKGYFEEFKEGQSLDRYLIPAFKDENGNPVNSLDIVRRRWLSNHYFGYLFDYEHTVNQKLLINAGLNANAYLGSHFGEIIDSEIEIPDLISLPNYYESKGNKYEIAGYGKFNYLPSKKISIIADLQLRKVDYEIIGIDNDLRKIDGQYDYLFFNPKIGLNYSLSKNQNLYISYAVAQREPSRSDFIDNQKYDAPKAESLMNLELGYRLNKENTVAEFVCYHYNYKNQLVNTGELNDVGAARRTNVAKSYRIGVEAIVTHTINKYISIHSNVTLSQNRIKAFDEVLFDYTNGFDKIIIPHQQTDISFSPTLLHTIQCMVKPLVNLEIELSSKYVSQQFMDNTSDLARSLPAFTYQNVRLKYGYITKYAKNLSLTLLINNVINTQYSSNGYTYSYMFGKTITENFLYPQAGTNWLLGLNLSF